MTKKIIFTAILALALVLGMMVVGCDNGSTDGGGNTITITGITPPSADYKFVNITVGNNLSSTALAKGNTTQTLKDGNSITFSLYDFQKNMYNYNEYIPWKEKGDFIIQLILRTSDLSNETYYLFTDGKTWDELGINDKPTVAEMDTKLPKYSISSSKSTIAFSKFQVQPAIK